MHSTFTITADGDNDLTNNKRSKIRLRDAIAKPIFAKVCRNWMETTQTKTLIFSHITCDNSLSRQICVALKWGFDEKAPESKLNKSHVSTYLSIFLQIW